MEAFKQEQAHKQMLNKELARLKEHDMKLVHERSKRLDQRKKKEIMAREESISESVRQMKELENKLREIKYESNIRENIEKTNFTRTMDSWAISGFSRAPEQSFLEKLQDMPKTSTNFINFNSSKK